MTLFRERGFSQVPVTDQGRLAGILTEADALRVLVEGNEAYRQLTTNYGGIQLSAGEARRCACCKSTSACRA